MHKPALHAQRLASELKALASPTRLEILHSLRSPRRIGSIRVPATRNNPAGQAARPVTRQAVTKHLGVLEEAGLVHRRDAGYVLDRRRMFAIVDEMRVLMRLRPEGPPEADLTGERPPGGLPPLPPRPRLLVAYGGDDSIGLGLSGRGPWRIGRSRKADIVLDHDPFVSSLHCEIRRREGRYALLDLGSRNGTLLDFRPLQAGAAPLESGGIITAGRTQLAFQA